MSIWKMGLGLVLLDFVALSVWAVATGGGIDVLVAMHTDNPWGVQIACDLVLALSMVSFFVWRDARARGVNPIPWVAATVFTGSIAPLLYFVLRPSQAAAPAAREGASQTASA